MSIVTYMSERSARGLVVFWVGVVLVGSIVAACSSDEQERLDVTFQFAPPVLAADGTLPARDTYLFEVGTHCGVGNLGLPINDRFWITDEAAGERDWIPSDWAVTVDRGEEVLTMELLLSEDGSVLVATVAGRPVTYRPVTSDDPLLVCE